MTAVPTTFIIDKEGIIREIVRGNMGDFYLDQVVDGKPVGIGE